MKTLKKASQRNVLINKYYYSETELKEMMDYDRVWYLDDDYNCSRNYKGVDVMNLDLRIECENAELKIICKDGYYTNVLIKNGKEYFVEL